ncbi:ribose-phosphate pyrophosphokinase [Oscillochloris trichoides DG-6]|uniref:ribose-phosphate diphosphokinase n=1 Tax=Oscillochloris trichoides DG-6 TaxID=765420 RepID=E1I9Y2_9CHLR|nr:ribose-phosphate pyrophosphokinase [Oscillochloris trichoides]EFO81984.1 ribose-phosphate pyrophosphokinase [Oscillochloris trichoides DG-6]
MGFEDVVIFAGSSSRTLTDRICVHLNTLPGRNETKIFSEGNTFVRVLENVRGREAFIVQSTVFPTNDSFMELLFWIDALKRASAASVTAVIPYFSYAKGDKKDEPRVSIRARVCADCIEAAGADRVVTMDLHAPQIQGFFRIPVDNLYALPVLCDHVRSLNLPNLVVVSPDAGFVKAARRYAAYLGASLAIANKERPDHTENAEVLEIIGEVAGKTALIVDDFTISGGTLAEVARRLVEAGAVEVYAMVTHGVFTPGSVEKIEASPLKKLFFTDSIETHQVKLSPKMEVVSVASLLAEAIRRIYTHESISGMFPV